MGCWRITPNSEEELHSADVILALAHGLEEEPSNNAIALIAERLMQRHGLLVIAQCQLTGHLSCAHMIGKDSGYLNRRQALFLMNQRCRKQGYKRVIIVSHRFALWLSMRCVERLGLEALTVDTRAVPHSPHSSQWWIRNSWLLVPYDILARVWFLFHGWI